MKQHFAYALGVSLAVMSSGFAQDSMVRHASYQQNLPHVAITPAMSYFTGTRPMPRQMPRQTMAQQQPQLQPTHKPFENLTPPPTLSPYLNLDRIETSVGLPNYHTFVRPQLQQQLAEQAEQAQFRRLRQQHRVSNARAGGAPSGLPSVPTTGQSTQFLNMGSYFPVAQ